MGHSFYLDTYYQLTDEKKKEMYQIEKLTKLGIWGKEW